MKIITFASWKGGTGKTTLATSCIKTLASQNKKILVIDLDSNLSMTRTFKRVNKDSNSIDLMNGDSCWPCETPVENVHIIPSNLRISRMTNISDRVLKINLKKMFQVIPNKFDYVFIDPPGTMNALTRNAICAADKVIIPSMPSMIDFEATGLVMEELCMMDVESDINIIINGWDTKRNVIDIYKNYVSEYKEFIIKSPVPAMKSLKNLTANISGYSLQGRARQIIDRFVSEVVK